MKKDELITKIAEIDEVFKQRKAKHYLTNFYDFNRDVIGWPDIYEPLHKKVCDFVQDNIKKKKLLILLPRGSFKSSMITIGYTLWRIAKNPNERVLISNAVFPMACQFLSQIKDHLSKNERFIELYGDLSAAADSWREDRITIAREKAYEQKEPTVWAFGMGSSVVGSHYSLAILDDMVNRENITTRDQIEKVINFYKDTLDLVDPSAEGKKQVIVIGTTWHQSDLYSWIQDDDTGIMQDFEMLNMPAFSPAEIATLAKRDGKLLFPKVLSWDILDELLRQQGPSHFSAQYLLNPVPLEDAVFKAKFKYYDETDVRGLQLTKFVMVDPALSEKKEADYSAMVCIGVDKNNDWYIRDLWRDKVKPKRLLDQMFFWNDKWKPVTMALETTAFQKVLQYFAYEEMKRRNKIIPITELKHTDRSKDDRIRGLEPRYEMGSIFHNKKVPYNDHLEDELRRFPRGKNDDLIDALASGLEVSFPPKGKERRQNKWKRSAYPA